MKKQESEKLIEEARKILQTGTEGKGLTAHECIAADIVLQWACDYVIELEGVKAELWGACKEIESSFDGVSQTISLDAFLKIRAAIEAAEGKE